MNLIADTDAPRDHRQELTVPTGDAVPMVHARVLQPNFALAQPEPHVFGLREIARILYRWRWLILVVILAAVTLAAVITLLTPPKYRAIASLEITQPAAELIQGSGVQPIALRDPQFLTTQYGLLRSKSLARRVVRSLNLAKNPALAPQNAAPSAREEIATARVAGNFAVLPVATSRLVGISYTSSDPALAAAIANGFADNFIAADLQRKFDATADARRFLQSRIASTKTALESSERALVQYAQSQGLVQVGGGEGGGLEPVRIALRLIQHR